jgi:isoleucyl-tRNA synthetase
MRFLGLDNNAVDFAIKYSFDCRSKIEYVLVKTFNQYTFSLTNVVLAKNLVGKQFGKGFYESKDLTDFENYKEGDKKIHTRFLQNVRG